MTMYVGDDLLIKVSAANPLTGRPTQTATVTVNAYNPAKNPRASAVDRAAPDHTVTLAYTAVQHAYTGAFATTGWTAGTWTLLVAVTGDLTGHEYRTITLADG